MGRLEVQTKPTTFAPNILRTSGTSYIEAGAYSISIANVATSGNVRITGADSVTADVAPGETISFSASESNGTIGRLEYDASSAEALIITLRK